MLPLILVGVGYALFSQDLTVSGRATAVIDLPSNGDTDNTYSRHGGPTTWTHSFNPFTVINTSSVAYKSWQVSFDIPADTVITGSWNVTYTIQGTRITFESMSYNGNINPGGNTTFGFSFTSATQNYQPTNIIVVGDDGVGQDSDYQPRTGLTVVATPGNGWQSGAYYVRQYNIVVSNNTGSRLKGWRVEVEWDDSVNQLFGHWSADYVEMPDLLRFSSQSQLENSATASFGAQLGLESSSSTPGFTVTGRL